LSKIKVGIDIGGTFTDFVLLDEEGNRNYGKTLTTYPDPSNGFLNGLEQCIEKYGFSYKDIASIVHGTTLVVNALIERKGVKTALITTKGFRDQLEIGNEGRFDLYDLFLDKPDPLVPRFLRYTVKERILADGEVLTELDEQEVIAVFEEFKKQQVEAVAVCLLHSYKNPVHEKKIREISSVVAPEIIVSISSEVSPEIREYQRTSTTVANVYVKPLVEKYLKRLEKELQRKGFEGQFHMMLSGGGTCTLETACQYPIRILESGPVGGAMNAVFYSKLSDISNLLVFDMGGTTAKASMVDHGKALVTNEFEVARSHRFAKGSGIPVKVPVIEMIEIGAGGGSIAYVDELGLLKVGPESASSQPGPACYGQGGSNPTVTDADLALGYLNPDYFLGGEMKLDKEAAMKAIEEKVAKPLGISVVEAAWGIHRMVNENMASAARIHTVEKGKEIGNYSMFATGGAGPVHASNVAFILDLDMVIFPAGAGVASAFGFLSSPIAFDFVRSYHAELTSIDWNHVMKLLTEMEAEGEKFLLESGIKKEAIEIVRTCEMRYVGQSHEITVPIPNGELNENSLELIQKNFEERYEDLYSESNQSFAIDTLNWRVVVKGPEPKISLHYTFETTIDELNPKGEREVYFSEYKDYHLTPVYRLSDFHNGHKIEGPAIIEDVESTLVVIPGFEVTADAYGNLILKKKNGLKGGRTNDERLQKDYV